MVWKNMLMDHEIFIKKYPLNPLNFNFIFGLLRLDSYYDDIAMLGYHLNLWWCNMENLEGYFWQTAGFARSREEREIGRYHMGVH